MEDQAGDVAAAADLGIRPCRRLGAAATAAATATAATAAAAATAASPASTAAPDKKSRRETRKNEVPFIVRVHEGFRPVWVARMATRLGYRTRENFGFIAISKISFY
jgi:hypothetical protein